MAIIPPIPAGGVTLKLTQQEAQKEAIGKALSLLGTVIGLTGTVIALSVNPAVKDATSGAFAKLPASVQKNTMPLLIVGGLVAAFVAYKWIEKGTTQQALGRYK